MKNTIEKFYEVNSRYKKINPEQNVFDFERIRLYSIVANSTAIEGATLTTPEVEKVINDGLPIQGKPMEHHFMVVDNYHAMLFAIEEANKKSRLTPELLKKFNALNMKNTGQVINSALGTTDMTKGDFRLMAAKSERLGYYQDQAKIPELVDQFCEHINQFEIKDNELDALLLAFASHCRLVLIHPWADGNKRTSRLLMNFIEAYYDKPLTKVYKEDIDPYLNTLKIAKDTGNEEAFIKFMLNQHIKTLAEEIQLNEQSF